MQYMVMESPSNKNVIIVERSLKSMSLAKRDMKNLRNITAQNVVSNIKHVHLILRQ